MLITNDFEVAQPVARVWEFFGDIPKVASCLPGADLTQDLGENSYGVSQPESLSCASVQSYVVDAGVIPGSCGQSRSIPA